MPSEWKNVEMSILHKKGSKAECGNYRGISLISHAAEVLLKLIDMRLRIHTEDKGLINEEQCGFREKRSTTDMLFVARRLQELAKARGLNLFLCFVDLKKAYDSVDRSLLWKILKKFGVPQKC